VGVVVCVAVMVVPSVVASSQARARSTPALKPSATRAKNATRLEVMLRYQLLDAHLTHHPVTLKIGCSRLTKRLYRCSFFGETGTDVYVYVINGKSRVRFYEARVRATLFDVSCSTYNLYDFPRYDFGC
jgi:hypothetical protein